jgi:hypothetical protein
MASAPRETRTPSSDGASASKVVALELGKACVELLAIPGQH